MAGLWDDINSKRKAGNDALVKAFDLLDQAGVAKPTKAIKRADRELAAATGRGDPAAVLMTAYILVAHGRPAPAAEILARHDALCQAHGDLAAMRGEAILRSGYGPRAGVRARRWFATARRLGVSSSVSVSAARQSAQALILVGVGAVIALAGAALRPLAASWRVIAVVAGLLVAGPGILRQVAFHRAWAVVLVMFFIGAGIVATR